MKKIRRENSIFGVVIGTVLGISYWMELSPNIRLILVVIVGIIFAIVWEITVGNNSSKKEFSLWEKVIEFILLIVIAVGTSIVVEYTLNFLN